MEQPLVRGWAQNYTKLGSRTVAENDMMMSALLWRKLGSDLIQNCDLPPPGKVFTVSEKAVISPINRICNMMGREYCKDHEFQMYRNGEDEKLEFLRALRLSQTRAREAERKTTSLAEERDRISNALLKEVIAAVSLQAVGEVA